MARGMKVSVVTPELSVTGYDVRDRVHTLALPRADQPHVGHRGAQRRDRLEQIEDALAVCLAFDITARLANAFDFAIAPPATMDAGARHLLKRGYR